MGSYLGHFGIILESFWDNFGIVLGSFWDRLGIVLGSFWDHFGIVLRKKKALRKRGPGVVGCRCYS